MLIDKYPSTDENQNGLEVFCETLCETPCEIVCDMFRNFDHLLTTKPHQITEVYISDLHLTGDTVQPSSQEYSQKPIQTTSPISNQTSKVVSAHHSAIASASPTSLNTSQPNNNLTAVGSTSLANSVLLKAFLALLQDLSVLPNLRRLYILGDWFEVWIGDDSYLKLDEDQQPTHWLTPIIAMLKKMRINGCHILVMHGNRDFLIGQPFCNSFAGELIDEPYHTQINTQYGIKRIRLEHGDALCTDDKDYQKFRKLTRKPWVQWWFLRQPISKREKLANRMRHKSKQATAEKSMDIMDVNPDAVISAMREADILIHGHTHRPAVHVIDEGKLHATMSMTDDDVASAGNNSHFDAHNDADTNVNTNANNISHTTDGRYVLGDWRAMDIGSRHERVTAVIGAVTDVIDDDIANQATTSEFELLEYVWRRYG